MAKKDVEEVLTIAAVKRLQTHNKEVEITQIKLGHYWKLCLDKQGFVRYRRKVGGDNWICAGRIDTTRRSIIYIIDLYDVTHTKLEQLYKELNEQKGC